jgi:kynurenine formamidase
MQNFEKIPSATGFKLSVLPVKWVNSTASPVRAVAIIED